MRQIGTVANERDAERFRDHLLTLDIASHVEEAGGGEDDGSRDRPWAVWVEDDDQLDRGRVELDAFTANPNDPRFAAAGARAAKLREEERRQAERRRKNFVDVRTRWGVPQQWSVPVTLALIAFSTVIFVLQQDKVRGPRVEDALRIESDRHVRFSPQQRTISFERFPASVARDHQVWRLVTPILMHGGILHILFNMLWLVDLGAMVERRKGSLFMAGLVLVIAVVSNLAQYRWGGPFFFGMSGVVFGLFGYVWIRGLVNPGGGIGVGRQTVIYQLVWLVLCMTGALGPIANAAHLVGLLVGLAFAYVPYAVGRLVGGRR